MALTRSLRITAPPVRGHRHLLSQVWWLQRAQITLTFEDASQKCRNLWIEHLENPSRACYQREAGAGVPRSRRGYFKLMLQEEARRGGTVAVINEG